MQTRVPKFTFISTLCFAFLSVPLRHLLQPTFLSVLFVKTWPWRSHVSLGEISKVGLRRHVVCKWQTGGLLVNTYILWYIARLNLSRCAYWKYLSAPQTLWSVTTWLVQICSKPVSWWFQLALYSVRQHEGPECGGSLRGGCGWEVVLGGEWIIS